MDLIVVAMYTLVAILGIVIGSFCNVCILRIPQKESVVFGASHCPKCQKKLRIWELVPVLSWVFLRGRCATCGVRISPQYPLIELANGLLWLLVFLLKGLTIEALLVACLVSTLLVLSVIDWRIREIPIQTTVFIAVLGVIQLVLNLSNWADYLLGAVSVSGVLLLLLLASKGRAIGGGDVKLMFGCGLFLGLWPTVFAFIAGCAIGSVVHLIRMKWFGAGRDLAMGPYLAIGVLLALLWGQDVVTWYGGLLGM